MGLGTERTKTSFCLDAGVVLDLGINLRLEPFRSTCSFKWCFSWRKTASRMMGFPCTVAQMEKDLKQS